MTSVLVTGGTGTLGKVLVPALAERGHRLRVLSRRGGDVAGAESLRGDVQDAADVAIALEGMDVVVHAATSPSRGARRTEVHGTRHIADQCAKTGAHLIYVSIVGVDRHRFPYYRAKWAAEQVVQASGAPWSIQRATQFHPLLDRMLGGPAFFATPNLSFQPVDPGEVAERLADIVDAGPAGRVEDFGGPAVIPIRELVDIRRRITGKRTRLVRVPRLGPFRDFDAGVHLCPEHPSGKRGWEEWLRTAHAGIGTPG